MKKILPFILAVVLLLTLWIPTLGTGVSANTLPKVLISGKDMLQTDNYTDIKPGSPSDGQYKWSYDVDTNTVNLNLKNAKMTTANNMANLASALLIVEGSADDVHLNLTLEGHNSIDFTDEGISSMNYGIRLYVSSENGSSSCTISGSGNLTISDQTTEDNSESIFSAISADQITLNGPNINVTITNPKWRRVYSLSATNLSDSGKIQINAGKYEVKSTLNALESMLELSLIEADDKVEINGGTVQLQGYKFTESKDNKWKLIKTKNLKLGDAIKTKTASVNFDGSGSVPFDLEKYQNNTVRYNYILLSGDDIAPPAPIEPATVTATDEQGTILPDFVLKELKEKQEDNTYQFIPKEEGIAWRLQVKKLENAPTTWDSTDKALYDDKRIIWYDLQLLKNDGSGFKPVENPQNYSLKITISEDLSYSALTFTGVYIFESANTLNKISDTQHTENQIIFTAPHFSVFAIVYQKPSVITNPVILDKVFAQETNDWLPLDSANPTKGSYKFSYDHESGWGTLTIKNVQIEKASEGINAVNDCGIVSYIPLVLKLEGVNQINLNSKNSDVHDVHILCGIYVNAQGAGAALPIIIEGPGSLNISDSQSEDYQTFNGILADTYLQRSGEVQMTISNELDIARGISLNSVANISGGKLLINIEKAPKDPNSAAIYGPNTKIVLDGDEILLKAPDMQKLDEKPSLIIGQPTLGTDYSYRKASLEYTGSNLVDFDVKTYYQQPFCFIHLKKDKKPSTTTPSETDAQPANGAGTVGYKPRPLQELPAQSSTSQTTTPAQVGEQATSKLPATGNASYNLIALLLLGFGVLIIRKR